MRSVCVAILACGAACAAGCKYVAAPFIMWGDEPTKSVQAEFTNLTGKRVAIVIWSDMDTLFEYPNVRLELSSYVERALKQAVKGIRIVPSREVIDLQNRNPDWEREDPAVLGEKLVAERVLVIELTQYTTRDSESPHLHRGQISANVKIYDVKYKDAAPVYKTEVSATYPEHGPGKFGATDARVRADAMDAFATKLANKFQDHKVKHE